MWKVIAFLLLSAAAIASEKRILADPYVHFETEGEPGYKICDAVSAVSGYVVHQDDIVIPGVEPIRIPRLYISGDSKTSELAGWTFFPHSKLFKYKKDGGYKSKGHTKYYVPEPSGAVISYTKEKKHTYKIDMDKHGFAITNTAGPYISARTNLARNVLLKKKKNWVFLNTAEGGERAYERKIEESEDDRRIYSTYLLQWERLPNGNYIHYGYDKNHRINVILTKNPARNKTYASAIISYFGEKNFKIETSDGRILHFHFGKRDGSYFLDHIDNNFAFTETFAYSSPNEHPNPYLQKMSVPLGRYWRAEYYQTGNNDVDGTSVNISDHNFRRRRVKLLFSPVGTDDSPIKTHAFFYNDNKKKKKGFEWPCVTHIYDAYGHHIEVISSPTMRPQSTTWFIGKDQPYCSEKTVWEGHLLKRKIFCDEKGNPLQQRIFTYDGKGNVLEESFFEKENECRITKYQYNDQNLMVRKEDAAGLVTLFSYLKGTDLLSARTTTDHQKIFVRELFEYDGDHILVRYIKEADGRRWVRYIEPSPNGLPAAIDERYTEDGVEKRLKRVEYTYSPQAKVTAERVFDAEGRLSYTLHKKYNPLGQIIEETDALGQITRHTYDVLGNQTGMQEPSGLHKEMVYDYANRLIQLTESGASEKHTISYQYDLKSRKIASTDSFGGTTRFSYDPFDHLVATHHPDGTKEEASYDCMGRKTSLTDACGFTTAYRYNFQGKPLEVLHSDGTVEKFTYDLSGRLTSSTDAQGVEIRYVYDVFGRALSKTTLSPAGEQLAVESWAYDSLHLLAKTSVDGQVTTYQYDGAGRKISENISGDATTFAYDSLGRLSRTSRGGRETVTVYDLLDRVVEERIDNLYSVQYAYDSAGNQTEIIRSGGIEATLYDAFRRPIQIVDARGHTTRIAYDDDSPQRKTTTAPDGVQTVETYDMRGRLQLKEKVSSLGELLSQEKYTYDGNSNLILQQNSVVWQGRIEEEIYTSWEYGPERRLLSITEALGTEHQRTTRYSYTSIGLKQTLLKPSGVTVHYDYDYLGRLTELVSTDGSCHYKFYYNQLHQPIQIDDLVLRSSTHRKYDLKSRLVSEQLSSGLRLQWTYDALDRKTSFTLPDKSFVRYIYDTLYLRRIERFDPGGALQYVHTYTAYNSSGNLLEESLIGNLGRISYSLDPDGFTKAAVSPYHTEAQHRSPSGHVVLWEKDGRPTRYKYDALSQLTEEEGYRYRYDSLGRRRHKNGKNFTFNPLHQTGGHYDADGRLTFKNGTQFIYDALDRLTQAVTDGTYLTFSYDSFHRRLAKSENGTTARFIYDNQDEIGAVDAEGQLAELRVLGIGKGAEIGAAISMEIHGQVYTPIHDLQGNLSKLISPSGKITAAYDYTAFGEPKGPHYAVSPWRFASKRCDDKTDLIFFGRRYYDSYAGRWLTPDPAGFVDGINLYAFVHNDPLLRLDLYGLFDMGPNYIRFSFEEVGTGLRALQFGAGYVLSAIGRIIPNALGGRTVSSLGRIVAGSNHYKSERPYTHHIVGSSTRNDIHGSYINGANTSFKEAEANASRFGRHFGNIPVTLVYNPSQGIVSDLVECILNQFGVRTAAVSQLAQTWRNILREFQSNNVHGIIPHGAHSQGGIITELALEMLSPEERSHLHVHTFGSGSLFSSRLAHSVSHHVSLRDGVPYVSPFRFMKSMLRHMRGKDSNVHFIGSPWGMPFIDHGISGGTYDEELHNQGGVFKETYGL